MPFKDPDAYQRYRQNYQTQLRKGLRRKEHECLETALEELRVLRALVMKQRKRIWFLEHKEESIARQRQRRAEKQGQAGMQVLTQLENHE